MRMMVHSNNDRCEAERKMKGTKKTTKHHTCLNAKRSGLERDAHNKFVSAVRENKRIWKFLCVISPHTTRRETYEHRTFLRLKLLLYGTFFFFILSFVVVATANCEALYLLWTSCNIKFIFSVWILNPNKSETVVSSCRLLLSVQRISVFISSQIVFDLSLFLFV